MIRLRLSWKSERVRLATTALLLAMLAVALQWPSLDGTVLPASDREQYENIAFNLARHGEFHDSSRLPEARAAGGLEPYSRREPGYPLYLASVFATSAEFRSLSRTCLSNPRCAAANPLRLRVQRLTAVVAASTVAGVFMAAYALAANWPTAVGAGFLYLVLLLLLPKDVPSQLSASLLLAHASLAACMWRRQSVTAGVASGMALGLLALTRAVFQYWLVGTALAAGAALWRDAGRRRALAPACVALVTAAWAVALPWMVRNAVQTGHFGISGRDGEVLAIRAEYGRMTWGEVRGAFAYFLPDVPGLGSARRLALRWFEPDTFGYSRFDRDHPHGFYQRTKQHTGDVAARADRIDPRWRLADELTEYHVLRDKVLKQAAADLIRTDWLKHTVLTLAFAERGGMFPGGSCRATTAPVNARFGALLGWPALLTCRVASASTLLFMPFAAVLLVVAWRRRDVALALLTAPVAYAFGIHAVATHFIPRYSLPLVPTLAVVFAIASRHVWLVCRARLREWSAADG